MCGAVSALQPPHRKGVLVNTSYTHTLTEKHEFWANAKNFTGTFRKASFCNINVKIKIK